MNSENSHWSKNSGKTIAKDKSAIAAPENDLPMRLTHEK
jgi:hypothetical protein